MNNEFFDASFIVLLCFLFFMFLALRYGYHKSISVLDAQIYEIKNTLSQAEDKLNQAQERLQQEKQKHQKLSEDFEVMIAEANHRIEVIKSQSADEIVQLIDFRQSTIDQMMDQIRLKTINDLKITLTDSIKMVLEDIMVHRLDAKTHEALNQDAINQLALAFKEGTHSSGKFGQSSDDTINQTSPLMANGA
jgi:F0F1-type ATP synthase membrane subunit b/b'